MGWRVGEEHFAGTMLLILLECDDGEGIETICEWKAKDALLRTPIPPYCEAVCMVVVDSMGLCCVFTHLEWVSTCT
jgi:hypothetical protein